MVFTLVIDQFQITKRGNEGEATVKFDKLTISNIVIDLSNGANPVLIPKFNGKHIISGDMIDEIKAGILSVFEDLEEDGFYTGTLTTDFDIEKNI